MAELNGIDTSRFNRGMGLAADGIKPGQIKDPNSDFSRLLNEAVNREKQRAASGPDASELTALAGPEASGNFAGPGSGAGPASDGTVPGIVPRQTHIDKTDKLYEQCLALETFLVKNILSAMRKNEMKSSLIDTGYAGEIYEDMLWDEYAKEYTKNAGFGLADLAYLELTGQRGTKPSL